MVATSKTPSKQPTARQREYLVFIKAFTDRWRVPPSFEEIGSHFGTTPPSVNNMIKTLEARGFISRVRGGARSIRVLVPDVELHSSAPSRRAPPTTAANVEVAVRVASAVIERLVPALKGVDDERLHAALNAVAAALELTLTAEGATEDQRRAARDTIVRTASIAQGRSSETRPGRRLPWWQRPGSR